MKIFDNGKVKKVKSEHYNYVYDYNTGFFARWGRTPQDDPWMAPFPEILDMEVTTICKGPAGKLCKFCYKSNNSNGMNMSFDTFKLIVDKMKPDYPNGIIGITQLAFGVDAQCESNPDIWKMMEYCRENKIVPNVTVADISDETADKLAKYCGAVAVSRYDDKNICYDSVKKLVDRGMKQVNIHVMISRETVHNAIETINDYHTDPRLKGMNAIVFLSLKKKGRGVGHTPLTQEMFTELAEMATQLDVSFGFDSCSANKYLKSIEGKPNYDQIATNVEPCESTLFSSYISADGEFYPCSFGEQYTGWDHGIKITAETNFVKDVWFNEKVSIFRKSLMEHKRNCPMYEV